MVNKTLSPWGFLALCILLGAAVYGNSLKGAFHYDDFHVIEGNPYIKNLAFIPQYFTDGRTSSSLPENSGYRPLCTLTFALLWNVAGGATWPFHVHKILSHALVAWLIFLIAAELMRRAGSSVDPRLSAAAGALLFLVHPGLSETVNYISSTSSLQCALFYLAAFWSLLRARLLLMGLFFLLSVLTKEEGATFPAAVFLYFAVFSDSRDVRALFRRAAKPLAVAGGAFILFVALYLGLKPATGALSYAGVSRADYFFTQIWAWIYYLLWIFAPWGYAIEHTDFGFNKSFLELRVLAGALVTLALVGLAARYRRRAPFLAFAAGWYFLTILPGSSVFPLTEPINEHRYYLSYALVFPGLTALAALALGRLPRKISVVALPACLGLLVGLSGLTVQQNAVWRTPESVWLNAIEKDRANGRAHNNLGVIYLAQNRLEQALEHFLSCSKLWADYKYCYLNQHITLLNLGRNEEAKKALDEMLRRDPEFVTGQYYHARYLLDVEKKADAALELLTKCDRNASGKYVPCLVLLTRALRQVGRSAEIPPIAERALALEPGNRDIQFALGLALFDLKRNDEARRVFLSRLERNPSDLQAVYNVAWAEMQLGNWTAARERWQQVVGLNPNVEAAWVNLGQVAQRLGDPALAERAKRELARINPGVYGDKK